MEVIKIIFFAFGSFFGVENSSLIAEKTNVTIDTEKQIIHVEHRNLFTMVQKDKDSIKAADELYRIGNPTAKDMRYDWSELFESYTSKRYRISNDEECNQLNASIELTYNNKVQLKDFAIDYVEEEDSYAFINVDSWHIETTTGVLKGNYWYFKDTISFSLSPTKNMPEEYKKYQKSLCPYWEKVKL